MKLLFATLLCSRDVDTFIFNWFTSRVNLSNGFSIPHLIVNDGTLTPQNFEKLRRLTNVFIEEKPVDLYRNVPKAKYLAKLKLFEIGFLKYKAERVVIIDADVFLWRPWDSDLANILLSDNIAMMDFGCSTGPEPAKYEEFFGIKRDAKTPTCNTGIVSTTMKSYDKILLALTKHLDDPFMIMEDQGVCFAAFHGNLDYIKRVKIAINGVITRPDLWNWLLQQNGAHLVGMRTRREEYERFVDHTLSLLPKTLHPSKFEPFEYVVSNGVWNCDLYNFELPFAEFPSQIKGNCIMDAIHLNGACSIKWKLPPQIKNFEATYMCLDNGDPVALEPIQVNGKSFPPGWFICIDVDRELSIETSNKGNKAYAALINPLFHFSADRPTTFFE